MVCVPQGSRFSKHGRRTACLRDVAVVVSGLGSCVTSEVADIHLQTSLQQVAVGPITGPTTQFTLQQSGIVCGRYKVSHLPQPMPSLERAREVMLSLARKRAETGEKVFAPKVR